jgi:hypothetical protein
VLGGAVLTSKVMLHMDITHDTTTQGQNMMVSGVSDRNQTFHPVLFWLCSQATRRHWAAMLIVMRRIYRKLFGEELERPEYFMGDADGAQRNAVLDVFEDDANTTEFSYLMCYFHVLKVLSVIHSILTKRI